VSRLRTRSAAVLLTGAIIVLSLATAYIHSTLGSMTSLLGLIFFANAAGYAVLAIAVAVAFWGRHPLVRRFSWLPRVALAAFALTTIGGYLVIGPYSTLGWLTKAIEVGIIVLVVLDVLRVHGSFGGLVRTAIASITGRPDPATTES
jgi:hypothetical protein